MRSWIWLRALAAILLLFAAGHTLGTLSSTVRHGPAEATVLAAMRGARFPMMGFERSYWELYQGFALTVGLMLFLMAVLAWQVGGVSRRNGATALPMAWTLLVWCVGIAVLGWMYFFWAPIGFATLGAVVAAEAIVLLRRERRATTAAADARL
jgi:hypothetical protein